MSDPLIVSVEQGKLRGRNDRLDINGENFYSFQGIPYAKPPVGQLRFKAPQPPEKWRGIRNATEEGSECYSKHMLIPTEYVGSEDCLILNVFTKQLPTTCKTLKPVMFWIHGGGFTIGSSKCDIYGPEFLITHDIVLVTINYRLGALGFLSLEDPSLGVSGNAGLKDMVMALKWVQKNIRTFCGDPNNVTIFGESAGGAAVHLLVLSPMAKGLFHKAIAQSGCALNLWGKGARSGVRLGRAVGIENGDEAVILRHLQNMPVEDLYKGVEKIRDPLGVERMRPFGPIVEKPSNEPAFLLGDPIEIIRSGKYNKVPFIMGYNSREGMMIYSSLKHNKKLLVHDYSIIPYTLNLRRDTPPYKDVGEQIRTFYSIDRNDPDKNKDGIYKMYTDTYFLMDILKSVNLHLQSSENPIYFYRFSLESQLNFMKLLGGIEEPGASHGDDLGYLFKGVATPDIGPNSMEYNGMRKITKLWTNFAKFSKPNSDDTADHDLPTEWPTVSKNHFQYLDIGNELVVKTDPEKLAYEFWEKLFQTKQLFAKL